MQDNEIQFFPEVIRSLSDDNQYNTLTLSEIKKIENSKTLHGHNDAIISFAILPSGQMVSGSKDTTLKVWDLNKASGKECVKILRGHGSFITSVAVLSNNRVLSGSVDKTVKIWDLNKPSGEECVQTLQAHDGGVFSAAALSDNRLVSGSADGQIKVWDLNQPLGSECVQTLQGHSFTIWRITVLSENRVVSSSWDGTIKIWDFSKANSLELIKTLYGHAGSIRSVVGLSNDRLISGAGDHLLKVWDLNNPLGLECVQTLVGHTSIVDAIAVLPNNLVISGCGDGLLKMWNLSNPLGLECVQTWQGHSGLVAGIAALLNNKIISVSVDHTIKIWETTDLSLQEKSDVLKAVSENTSLEKLNLSHMAITDLPKGLELLKEILEKHPTLMHLDVSYTSLKDEGFEDLFKVISDKKQIKNINIAGNPMTGQMEMRINNYLSQSSASTKKGCLLPAIIQEPEPLTKRLTKRREELAEIQNTNAIENLNLAEQQKELLDEGVKQQKEIVENLKKEFNEKKRELNEAQNKIVANITDAIHQSRTPETPTPKPQESIDKKEEKDKIKLLIGELSQPDEQGLYPVHHAARLGHLDLLKQYFALGIDFTVQDREGFTVLHHAVIGDQSAAVALFSQHADKVPFNEPNKAGLQATHLAAFLGRVGCLHGFYLHGEDLNARDVDGKTPLHWAVSGLAEDSGSAKTISYLLLIEVNPKLADHAGNMPYQLAKAIDLETLDVEEKKILSNLKDKTLEIAFAEKAKDLIIRNLVFQGGGVKGIAYLGAIKGLENNKVKLENIKRVGGASAGAITALLVGLNYNYPRLKTLLSEQNFKEFADGNWMSELLFGLKDFSGWPSSVKVPLLLSVIGGILTAGTAVFSILPWKWRLAILPALSVASSILNNWPSYLKIDSNSLSFPNMPNWLNSTLLFFYLPEGVSHFISNNFSSVFSSNSSFLPLSNITMLFNHTRILSFISNMTATSNETLSSSQLFPPDMAFCKGEALRNWVEERIYEQTGLRGATFRELVELAEKNGIKVKEMYFVGVNLSTGKTEVFSYETTPDAIVSDAVRISMSIPLFYKPHFLYIKNENNKRIPHPARHIYIDGGINDNYPLWLFDAAKHRDDYQELIELIGKDQLRELGETRIFNLETLGLRLVPIERKRAYEAGLPPKAKSIENIFEFVTALMDNFYEREELEHGRSQDALRTVYINDRGIGMTDFGLGDQQKDSLRDAGELAVNDFFRHKKSYVEPSINGETLKILLQYCAEFSLRYEHNVLMVSNGLQCNMLVPVRGILELYKSAKSDAEHAFLKRLGFNPSKLDSKKFPAIYYAVKELDEKAAFSLVIAGADIYFKTQDQETLLDVLAQKPSLSPDDIKIRNRIFFQLFIRGLSDCLSKNDQAVQVIYDYFEGFLPHNLQGINIVCKNEEWVFANGAENPDVPFMRHIVYDRPRGMSAARETMAYQFFSTASKTVNFLKQSVGISAKRSIPFYQYEEKAQKKNLIENTEGCSILHKAIKNSLPKNDTDSIETNHVERLDNYHDYNHWHQEQDILFDNGLWDSEAQRHLNTGELLFTYRVFKDDFEVGSAIFYKHPLLCRSEDGMRHNIVAFQGVLKNTDIEEKLGTVEDICQALPPTFLEKATQTANRSAQHGAIRGTANVISYALNAKGVSHAISQYANYAIYYGGMFCLQYGNHYQILTSSDMPEAQKITTAACQAAFDTGTLIFTQTVIHHGCQLAGWIGQKAKHYGWQKTGETLQAISGYSSYGSYAYQAFTQGALQTGTAIVSGVLSGTVVEKVGKYSIDKLIGLNGLFGERTPHHVARENDGLENPVSSISVIRR